MTTLFHIPRSSEHLMGTLAVSPPHKLSKQHAVSMDAGLTIQPLLRYTAMCTTCIPPLKSKIDSLAGQTGLPSTRAADTAAKKAILHGY